MDNYQKLNEEIKKIPAAVNCSENPLLLSIVKLGEEDYEVKQEEEEIDLHESELKGGNNRLRAVPKQKRIFKVRRVVVCKVKK